MADQAAPDSGPKPAPVVIKKYANRRLYNTATSAYVTLDHLSQMVKDKTDFVVYDAKTGEDITRSVLTQIIFEEESKGGQTLLPIPFLRSVIGVALWESTIASVIYLGIVPITALMTRNPLILIVYILDAPALMVPVLMQASRRNEFWKAVVSIPSFFVLRIVNCLFVLEAIWSEFITGQRLAVYEKGH